MWGHVCMSVPKMKFLCLNLWIGEVCTDANDTNNANDDIQWTKHEALADKPSKPKIKNKMKKKSKNRSIWT